MSITPSSQRKQGEAIEARSLLRSKNNDNEGTERETPAEQGDWKMKQKEAAAAARRKDDRGNTERANREANEDIEGDVEGEKG